MIAKAMALMALLCAGIDAAAAAPRHSVWDGVYSDAQAERGQRKYGGYCAVCHGVGYGGDYTSPTLTGQFFPDWQGMSVADLFDKIQRTMPLGRPGTLSNDDTADIVAYILQQNEVPGGNAELSGDAAKLKGIVITPRKLAKRPAPTR